ncbi:MAG: N-acetylmuramoyl-L-alanine amidase [Lachnospiraceae bacterium]|nr:N-acetylmuramoyl-L-alanine amidase [Lachnospiraceae bacterium]
MIIALDPGHGGGNSGLTHNGIVEKHITRITAQAMKEELERYENVEVFITDPDEECDMSLKERAANAKNAGADVLISLHFNMSEEHTMFGSEVWIPCNGLHHADMHSLGDIFMEQFGEIGLTKRGVKTRLNDRGTDYYGILRESVALDMNAILVEHCYADHAQDAEYIASDENYKAFGKMDATAVAKYYHLKSIDGTADYTDYVKNGYFAPESAVGPDKTGPEAVSIKWTGTTKNEAPAGTASDTEEALTDEEAQQTEQEEAKTPDGRIRNHDIQTYHIQGNEPETEIVYYEYSLDGGQSWSGLMPFAPGQTQMDIQIEGVMPGDQVVARLYNGYTVSGRSNTIEYKPAPPMEAIDSDRDVGSLTKAYESGRISLENLGKYYRISERWNGIGIILTVGCLIGLIVTLIEGRRLKERARTRRKQELIGLGVEQASKAWEGTETKTGDMLPTNLEHIDQAQQEILSAKIESQYRREYEKRDRRKRRRLARLTVAWGFAVAFMFIASFIPKHLLGKAMEEQQIVVEEALEARDEAARINDEHEKVRKQQEKEANELIVISEGEVEGEYVPKTEPETVTIYDIAKGYMRVPLVADIARNPYDLNAFTGEGLKKSYPGAMIGIDVSKFQGDIDWEAVAASGVQFVIIRLGSRGYGSGELVMDDKFVENIEGAQAAGIKTGVYFFSTALNEKEAVAEADYVLDAIAGYRIDMPVVFDTEIITYDKARNADMTPNELTQATRAFCDRIKNAGYTPMIYANAKRFTTVLHLEELEGYEKWLADYRSVPDYPYDFRMLQFTEHGSVPGIATDVDINLLFSKQ